MQWFNQHSLLVVGMIGLALLVFLLFRDGVKKTDIVILAIIIPLFVLLWYFWHPKQDEFQSSKDIQARIGQGTPVLIEFQSPY